MRTITEKEINNKVLQGFYWLNWGCRESIRNQHGKNTSWMSLLIGLHSGSKVIAAEVYSFYRSHEENKLCFVCTHQPEMACVSHIWSQVYSYMPIKAPSIRVQKTICPSHGKHKQYLRFQTLQLAMRRTIEFWSLLDFCTDLTGFLGWVCVDCGLQFPHKTPN